MKVKRGMSEWQNLNISSYNLNPRIFVLCSLNRTFTPRN